MEIELNKQGDKSVIVIMMNPSKADMDYSDDTINFIVDFFSKLTP